MSSGGGKDTRSPALSFSGFKVSTLLLRLVGSLLFLCAVVSFHIGNYYHLNHQRYISTTKAQKIEQFYRKERKFKYTNTSNRNCLSQTNLIHERVAFESIIERVKWTEEQCSKVPDHQRQTLTTSLKNATDLPPLPEGGVALALKRWMEENNKHPCEAANCDDCPTCYLPPPKSCDVTTYTIIIMAHTTGRLKKFMDPLIEMTDEWRGMTEIILVWNSPRTTLIAVNTEKEQQYATQLLAWDKDPSHPLRIFFSLEEGLTNNLLNRYHPKLRPKNQAVMYFDDDGPFFSKEAMVDVGLELWRRNSNVQVGAWSRNIRYLSSRMKVSGKKGLKENIDIVANDAQGDNDNLHPSFTPYCRNITQDYVDYNRDSFPDFNAHILLPSGSILHRNFFCFIWHPAFKELREWVAHHKTMPDDMTVSMLVSHLAGKAPRTFPREIGTTEIDRNVESSTESGIIAQTILNQSHRRLGLWNKKGWFDMRVEAINSILGYFGSMHQGSVGWCAGTIYSQDNDENQSVCIPEQPTLNLIPWLNEGIGSDHCPTGNKNVKYSVW